MRDTIATLFRAMPDAPRAPSPRLLLVAACALGGCAGGGAASGSFAMASGGSGQPWRSNRSTARRRAVFDRMVSVLDSESKLRNLSIVSREGARLLPRAQLSLGAGRARQEP